MYSTCLFCTKDLGANDVVETLPIGRRLAFDAAEGRLWVVCRHCAKWNLVPFDTRLESIDACERLFRDTPTRYSTDNIGLARVKEGLELVRIGPAQRPEFAGWRYGDQFGKRRRRNLLILGGMAAVPLAIAGWGLTAGAGFVGLVQLPNFYIQYRLHRRVAVRVPRPDGPPIELTDMQIGRATLIKRNDGELMIRTPILEKLFTTTGKKHDFVGEDFERLLPAMLARCNLLGGTQKRIQSAVELVAQHGSVFDLMWYAKPKKQGHGSDVVRQLGALSPEWLLAAEIAHNEGAERKVMEGELRLLEWHWKEAERLAKLADGLALGEG